MKNFKLVIKVENRPFTREIILLGKTVAIIQNVESIRIHHDTHHSYENRQFSTEIDKQKINYLSYSLLDFLTTFYSPEQIEEWIGDLNEDIEITIKNKNYNEWIIELIYSWQILIVIYSAIKIKASEYISDFMKKQNI